MGNQVTMKLFQAFAIILSVAVCALTGCADDPASPGRDRYRHVPADYPTIQAAIDAAAAGDTVLVAAGTYSDLYDYTLFYGREIRVAGVLKQGVVLRGATGDPADVVIDLQGEGWGLWCKDVDGATGVSSLTIRNAMWAFSGHTASPWIGRCVFENNGDVEVHSSSAGTGMYFDRSASLVTDCVFRGNEAGAGAGATFSSESDVRFERCTFTDNQARDGGGLVVGNDSRATLVDCTVSGNSATERGGGIHAHGMELVMIGGSITGNAAGEKGGGLSVSIILAATLEDVDVSGNSAMEGPQGYAQAYASVVLRCCSTEPAGWVGDVAVSDEGCNE